MKGMEEEESGNKQRLINCLFILLITLYVWHTHALVSFNVSGLSLRRCKIEKNQKTWFLTLSTPLQIIILQEHHLNDKDYQNGTKGIDFLKGMFFWNPTIPTCTTQRMSIGSIIHLNNHLVPKVIKQKHFVEQQACGVQNFKFSNPNNH